MGLESCFGNGKTFPPGFRFHPTDEELVLYHLKGKICRRSLRLDIIAEVDVYKWDPEDLPGLSKLKSGDRQWFFFSPRDRKYPNGARSNRATIHGYWKATGKDRIITCNSRSVGVKKTLVFYLGRAPSGQRTDWVMHEYTLDEDELKRCRTAYDYYALYKVFKKSGPGPKNGEQYGAPFKEEEWDEECLDFNGLLEQEDPVQVVNPVIPPVDNSIVNDQEGPLTYDLEESLNKIADEPIPLLASTAFKLVIGEEEAQSSLLNYSSRKVDFLEQRIVMHPSYEPYVVQGGFEAHTATQLQQNEASEVTSVPNIPVKEHQPQVAEEDFLEDFLEMDDLAGPEPTTVLNFEKPVEEVNFDELDGLCEFDLYHDSAMFCREMGPVGREHMSQSYMNNLENGIESSGLHSYLSNAESEVVNYQLHDTNQLSYELWTHEQQTSVFAPAEATQGATPSPSPGVVVDGNSAMPNSVVNQSPQNREDDGSDSWFSSALWAFVESIPTTPASASESSALVNRAFVRMSSFGKGRVNIGDASGDNSISGSRRSGRSSRGIIYFSILGVLLAILWMFIGTSVELLGRCIS